MAIYKPSNCSPFLGAVDLTKPVYLQCDVNTSNVEITGYKIRILDNNNNIIFEGISYTPLPNSKIMEEEQIFNGSVLAVPLVVTDQSLMTNNTILYDKQNRNWQVYSFSTDTGKPSLVPLVNFNNGYIYLPYKWQISLMQGTAGESQWYDMEIASGKVLGSTINRIQGPISNYIYADYYIQLCNDTYQENDGEKLKSAVFQGNRVLIDSYDFSLGHIYPVEGEISQANLDASSYFQIYKYGNSLEDIIESGNNRYVDYATTLPMSGTESASVSINGNNYQAQTFSFDNKSNFYCDQHFCVAENSEGIYSFTPLATYYDTGATSAPPFTSQTTRLLIKNEGIQDENSGVYLAPQNGVYTFVESFDNGPWTDTNGTEKSGYIDFVVRWERPSDVDSWAEMIGKALYVVSGTSAGLNYESTATAMGVINESSIGFQLEQPIKIYPSEIEWTNQVFGQIYKNTNQTIYIGPSASIAAGMYFNYITQNSEGEYSSNSFLIQKVDSTSWSVSLSSSLPSLPPPPASGTQYSITSNFRESDETPFYAYSTPVLNLLYYINDTWEGVPQDMVINNRLISVQGDYFQAENQNWKSYSWSLIDLTTGLEDNKGTIYGGQIQAQFVGLQEGHYYTLELTVEDEFGRTVSSQVDFSVELGAISDGDFPLSISFDCDTQSVDINFVKQGKIIPNPEYGGGILQFEVVDSSSTQEPTTHVPLYVQTQNNTNEIPFNVLSSPRDGIAYLPGEGVEISSEGVLTASPKRDFGLKYEEVEFVPISSSGEAGATTTVPLAGPDDDTFTINSKHTFNSFNFSDRIYEVAIDVESKIEDYLRIKFYLNLGNLTTHDSNGLLIANPSRYQIFANITRETSQDGEKWVEDAQPLLSVPVSFNINGQNYNEWEINGASSHPIAFALVDQDFLKSSALAEENNLSRDWLITEGVYFDGFSASPNLRHLVNSIFNCLDIPIRFPTSAYVSGRVSNQSLWSDNLLTAVVLPEGRTINVENMQDVQFWSDEGTWLDAPPGDGFDLYVQQDINAIPYQKNYSGRQRLQNKTIVFNNVVYNFDIEQNGAGVSVSINSIGFMQ